MIFLNSREIWSTGMYGKHLHLFGIFPNMYMWAAFGTFPCTSGTLRKKGSRVVANGQLRGAPFMTNSSLNAPSGWKLWFP